MSRKLLKAGPREIVSGLHPGLQDESVPLWENGSNIMFEDAAAKPGPGQSPLFVRSSFLPGTGVLATTGLMTTQDANAPGLIWGDREHLFRGVEMPITEDVTRLSGNYTGTDQDQWSIVQFGHLVLATNGVDPVQYLAADADNFVDIDTVSDLPSTFRCQLLAKLGAYIIALNTDNDAAEYRWCDEDDPLTWIPAATNSARDIQMRELNSGVIAVVPLARGLAAIGKNAIRFISYIGPPFYFGDTNLIGNIGAVSKYAVVEAGRILYGFGPDGIWASDGTAFNYIDQPAIHKYIYTDNLDIDRMPMVSSWNDSDNSMLYFSFPTTDGVGRTVGWDYKHSLWTIVDFWRPAATDGGAWQIPITLDAFGNVWGQGVRGQPMIGDPSPVVIYEAAGIVVTYDCGLYDEFFYDGWAQYGNMAYGQSPGTRPDYAYGNAQLFLTTAGGTVLDLSSAIDTAAAWILTKALDFGAPRKVKFIDTVLFSISNREAQTNLALKIYGSDDEDGPFTLLDTIMVADDAVANTDPPGFKFFKFRFYDAAIVERWQLGKFEVWGEFGGDEF